MAHLSDPAMRDLIKAEVRVAVANYFMPLRLIASLVVRGGRFVLGLPGPSGRDGRPAAEWWRSA